MRWLAALRHLGTLSDMVGQLNEATRANAERIEGVHQRIDTIIENLSARLLALEAASAVSQRTMDTLRNGISEMQDLRREMKQSVPLATRSASQFRKLMEIEETLP